MLDAGFVLRQLATRAPGPWPWSRPQPFDPIQWDLDLRRIERVYEAQGYYGTQVVDSDVEHGPDGVRLWARVREAPATIVRDVEIAGTEALAPDVAREVRAAVQVHAGQRFLEQAWDITKRGVEERLREHGYARASVDGQVRVLPQAHTADVTLRVAPGRVYRFGPVIVAGDPRGPTAEPALTIARAMMPEGTVYSPSALKTAQERIFSLGAYSAVAVSPAAPDPGTGRLPILVELRDSPQYALRLGGGIGADPARQQVHAAAEWVDRDFLGELRTLRLSARGGVAFAPSVWGAFEGAGPDHRWGPLASLVADFGQPVLAHDAALSLFAAGEGTLAPGEIWNAAHLRAQGGVVWRLGRRTSLQLSYGLERWWLYDTLLGGAAAAPPAFGCDGRCVLSYAEQRLSFDARDDPRDAHSGYLLQLRVREFVGALGSSFTGLEGVAEARGYLPLAADPRVLLAARVRVAAVDGDTTAPVMLRLFSGDGEMRGYGERRLSPRLRLPDAPQYAVPTGGQALVDGTVELRWTLRSPLALVLFADAGAVTLERFDPGRLAGALQVAAGAGLRWHTQVAPIRLDLAFLLPVGAGLETYDVAGARAPAPPIGSCFGLGGGSPPGATDGRCALHIWIGEVF